MPESTLLLGVATMPLSDALPLGVIVEPVVDVPSVPAVPVWAKAKPEAARLMHRLLATNKRDISFSSMFCSYRNEVMQVLNCSSLLQ
jgi:hypothetical protein